MGEDKELLEFYYWVRSIEKEELKKDIIALRGQFLSDKQNGKLPQVKPEEKEKRVPKKSSEGPKQNVANIVIPNVDKDKDANANKS